MSMKKAIEKLSDDIIRCYRCGDCREMWRYVSGSYGVCPVREELRHEHFCGRGRVGIARAILEDQLEYNEGMVDLIYNDLCCWNCQQTCTLLDGYQIPVSLISRAMREDLVNLELGPPEPLKKIDTNIEETGNRFGNTRKKRTEWAKEFDISEKADTVYFVGCYASYVHTGIAQSTAKILKAAGVEFTLLKDESCCGVTSLWDGETEIAKKQARHNVDAIRASGAKRVVVSCAEGYHTIKKEYSELLGEDLGFDVIHTTDLFASELEKGKIKFKKDSVKVTYHDPCQLGRGCGIYDSPRKIIESIPGVSLVEMLRNRNNAFCCGSGTGQIVRTTSPDLAKKIAVKRLKEATDTGADVLVTTCPFCIGMFNAAEKEAGVDIRIQSLTEFVVEHLSS
jgi:Fe-S oxidoreductase